MSEMARRRDFDLAVLAACESLGARQEFTVEALINLVPAPGADHGATAHRDAISCALSRLTKGIAQLARVRRGVYTLRADREPLPQLAAPRNRAERRSAAERRAERLVVSQKRAARRLAAALAAWPRPIQQQGEQPNGNEG